MSNHLIQQFQQIDELLKSAKRVLIASHENPDPDAVSSVLCLHYIFKKHDLESFPYLPDSPSKNLSFLPGFFEIKTEIEAFQPDILFGLDYGDFKRLRIPEHILENSFLKKITIDHHLEGDQRGEVKILESGFSSTTEIIYHWLKFENIEIDKEIATCLLTGIISDSGGFRHVSTSSGTLSIVSELLLKGVSLNKIARQTLTFNKSPGVSRAWGQILFQTKLDEGTNLAYSWLSFEDLKKFRVNPTDFEGIANLISTVSPQNLGLFLVEYEKGKIKGSLRSEPSGEKNVIEAAKALNGGGHYYASGFSQEGTIEETLKKVLNLIK